LIKEDIILYVDSRFISPYAMSVFVTLVEKDVQYKARARQIQAWIRSDFPAIRKERSTEVVFCKPSDKPLSKAAEIETEKLFAATDTLIKDGNANFIDDWRIADTDLALMLNRLVKNGDGAPEKLKEYALHQWERPSVQLWVNKDHSL
jgi:glutathione S-transferase